MTSPAHPPPTISPSWSRGSHRTRPDANKPNSQRKQGSKGSQRTWWWCGLAPPVRPDLVSIQPKAAQSQAQAHRAGNYSIWPGASRTLTGTLAVERGRRDASQVFPTEKRTHAQAQAQTQDADAPCRDSLTHPWNSQQSRQGPGFTLQSSLLGERGTHPGAERETLSPERNLTSLPRTSPRT